MTKRNRRVGRVLVAGWGMVNACMAESSDVRREQGEEAARKATGASTRTSFKCKQQMVESCIRNVEPSELKENLQTPHYKYRCRDLAMSRRSSLQLSLLVAVLHINMIRVEGAAATTCTPIMNSPCGKNLRILTHYSAPFVMFNTCEFEHVLKKQLNLFAALCTNQKCPPEAFGCTVANLDTCKNGGLTYYFECKQPNSTFDWYIPSADV
eukprot:762820-Hanusia_phi.AAC.10